MPHTTLDLFHETVEEFITEDRKNWLEIEPKNLNHKEVRKRLELFQQLRTRVLETFTEAQLAEESLYQEWSPIEDSWCEHLSNLINRLYDHLKNKNKFKKKGSENKLVLLNQYCEYWWIYRREFSNESQEDDFIKKDSVLAQYDKSEIQDDYLKKSQRALQELMTLEANTLEDHRAILAKKHEFNDYLDRLHQLPILFKKSNSPTRTKLIEALRIKSDNPLHEKIKKSEKVIAQHALASIRKELEKAKAHEEEARKKAEAIKRRKTIRLNLLPNRQRRRGSKAALEAASAAQEKLLAQEEKQHHEEQQRLQKQLELKEAKAEEDAAKAIAADLQAKLNTFYLDAELEATVKERREAYELLIYVTGKEDASNLPTILESARDRWNLIPDIKKELRCVKLTGKNWGDFGQLCKLAEKRISRDHEDAIRLVQQGQAANNSDLQQQITQRNQERLDRANQISQSLPSQHNKHFASWSVTISCSVIALGTSIALFATTDWLTTSGQLALTNPQIGLITIIALFTLLAIVMALVTCNLDAQIKQAEQKITGLRTPLTLESLKKNQQRSQENWQADQEAWERRSILLGHKRDPNKVNSKQETKMTDQELLDAAKLV